MHRRRVDFPRRAVRRGAAPGGTPALTLPVSCRVLPLALVPLRAQPCESRLPLAVLHGALAARRTHHRTLAPAPLPPRPRPRALAQRAFAQRALAPAPSSPRPRPRTVGTFCTHQHMAHPRAQGLIFYRVAASDAALADGQSTLGAFTFVMLISYLLPFAAIPIFVYDKQFYLRESGLGLYPTWAHTISQACAPPHPHRGPPPTSQPPPLPPPLSSTARRHAASPQRTPSRGNRRSGGN